MRGTVKILWTFKTFGYNCCYQKERWQQYEQRRIARRNTVFIRTMIRYFNRYTYLKENKQGVEVIPKLRERQNELLRLIDFAKDQL